MTLYDSFVQIRRLLDLLPNVCVVGEHWSNAATELVLYVAAHDSLVSLARCALAACVSLSVEPCDFHWDEPLPPGQDELRYIIRIPRDGRTAEMFGANLVRDVLDRGLINSSDADELETAWKGALN